MYSQTKHDHHASPPIPIHQQSNIAIPFCIPLISPSISSQTQHHHPVSPNTPINQQLKKEHYYYKCLPPPPSKRIVKQSAKIIYYSQSIGSKKEQDYHPLTPRDPSFLQLNIARSLHITQPNAWWFKKYNMHFANILTQPHFLMVVKLVDKVG